MVLTRDRKHMLEAEVHEDKPADPAGPSSSAPPYETRSKRRRLQESAAQQGSDERRKKKIGTHQSISAPTTPRIELDVADPTSGILETEPNDADTGWNRRPNHLIRTRLQTGAAVPGHCTEPAGSPPGGWAGGPALAYDAANSRTAHLTHCSDFRLCRGGGNADACVRPYRQCPRFPGAHFMSYTRTPHDPLINLPDVCGNCETHGEGTKTALIASIAGGTTPNTGHRIQLCRDCIRDEMELYHERTNSLQQAQLLSHGPSSMDNIALWPAVGRIQDLCICRHDAIDLRGGHYCHSCRDVGFRTRAITPCETTHRYLTRKSGVIDGTIVCDVRAQPATHVETRRRWRPCPCGKPAKRPLPQNQEYITICAVCMGVWIDPNNLPTRGRYRYGPQHKRRRRVRPIPTTKGRGNAQRDWKFRVNIERGWVHPDPNIGGA